jgi:hypothetical protein
MIQIKSPQQILDEKYAAKINWKQVDAACDYIASQLNQNFDGTPYEMQKLRKDLTKEEETEVIKRFEEVGWKVSLFQEDRAKPYWLLFEGRSHE